MDQKKYKKLLFKYHLILTISLASFLIISLVGNAILLAKINNNSGEIIDKVTNVIIQPVSAAEIYPEFMCGCCGKALDPNNVCCGDMKQKIAYIDTQVDAGFSKEEIMMRTTKEFGLNSLIKEETKIEIKSQLIANAPADAPKIVFISEQADIGVISQSNGITTTTFSFTNNGQGDLIIDNLTTSCGCTSASIVYNGSEGPSFTMPGHGKDNPTNWSVAIAPGDTAQVKIYYDPNAHGPQKKDIEFITRTISVFSNDPVEFEKQLKIELEQIP